MSPFKWGKFRKILSMMHNPLSYSHSFLIFNKFPCPITIAFKHLIRIKSAVPPLRCKYLIAFKAEAKCLINRTAKQHLSSFHPLTSFARLMKNPLWLPAYGFRLWLCFWATSSCPLRTNHRNQRHHKIGQQLKRKRNSHGCNIGQHRKGSNGRWKVHSNWIDWEASILTTK